MQVPVVEMPEGADARWFCRQSWRGHGHPVPEPKRLEDLERSEWSPRFERLMRNRLIMGALRYGLLNAPGKQTFDRLGSIIRRAGAYRGSGNDGLLADIANLALLEFEEGVHPRKHLGAEDDGDHVSAGTLDQVLAEVRRWQVETFGDKLTFIGVAKHILKEANELTILPEDPEEMADIIMLCHCLTCMVLDHAEGLGVDATEAVRRKLEVCRGRTWVDNGNGFHEHDRYKDDPARFDVLTPRQREILTILRDGEDSGDETQPCDLVVCEREAFAGTETTSPGLVRALERLMLISPVDGGGCDRVQCYEINESGRRALKGLPPYMDGDGNHYWTPADLFAARNGNGKSG